MMNQQHSYNVCILAGGEGRRFGGRDKGLIEYQGKPLIEHLIESFCAHTDEIIISANRNLDRYKNYNRPVISDLTKTYAGPLAGVLAACAYCQNKWLLVAACDQPDINHTLVNDMLDLAKTNDSKLIVTNDGFHNQPLPMLLHTSLQSTIESFLNSGERKVALWQTQQNALILKLNQRKPAININAPADL
jgi:molybdopterin-guanine dinucleotide biosynthesis protein A